MGINLIELKTRGNYKRFMIQDTIDCKLISWGNLNIKKVLEYLEDNEFPKDKEYSEKGFLFDVERAGKDNPITLSVKKKDTADFICKLIYTLI